jgi:hypothetical protein
VKLVLGAVATMCVAVGVAAQTGTVQLPQGDPRTGGVSGPQQAAPVSPSAQPSALAIATPAAAAAIAAPPPPPAETGPQPRKKKHGGG